MRQPNPQKTRWRTLLTAALASAGVAVAWLALAIPPTLDTSEEKPGGDTTVFEEGLNAFSFPAANLDPAAFDRADEVLIDRAENRHLAFGLGIHRCLGSNLARLELRVAVEEFLAAFPNFEIADSDAVTWSVGQIRGPRTVPVRIGA